MFKVLWDKENKGVRLAVSPSGEVLNVRPCPLFWEEVDFLGLDKIGWQYPHCYEPLLWACEPSYSYKGEWELEIAGENWYENHTIDFCKDNKLHLSSVSIQRIREVNDDTIFLLEHEAMVFIDGEYRKYQAVTLFVVNAPISTVKVTLLSQCLSLHTNNYGL